MLIAYNLEDSSTINNVSIAKLSIFTAARGSITTKLVLSEFTLTSSESIEVFHVKGVNSSNPNLPRSRILYF